MFMERYYLIVRVSILYTIAIDVVYDGMSISCLQNFSFKLEKIIIDTYEPFPIEFIFINIQQICCLGDKTLMSNYY